MNFIFLLMSYGCLILTAYSTATLEDQYIGCYHDSETNSELGDETSNPSMTISTCIEFCKSRKRTYAGAQNGSKCFCADSYGKNGTSTKCNVVCSGDSTYNCGGVLQNSVYAVCPISLYGPSCEKECHCKNRMPCNIRNGSCLNGCATGWTGKDCNTTTTIAPLSYQGCYNNDITYLPFIWTYVLMNNFMTVQWCIDECRAKYPQSVFLYAGLQQAYKCTCGYSNYTGAGISNNCGKGCTFSDCACTGNTRQKGCGGAGANAVYSVCQFGYFGPSCSQQCHCANGSNCTMETGSCGSSGCAPGWSGSACNIRNCNDNNGNCREDKEICATESLGPGTQHIVTRCRCKRGYTRGMEHERCIDVDECLPWMENVCDSKISVCQNSEGDYACECFEGFTNSTSNKVCEVTTVAISTAKESPFANVEESENAALTAGHGMGVDVIVPLGVGVILLLLAVIATIIFIAKRKRKPSVSAAYESTNNTDVDGPSPIYTELKTTQSANTNDDIFGTALGNSPYETINDADVGSTLPVYAELMSTQSTTDGNITGTALGNSAYETINKTGVDGKSPTYTELMTTQSTTPDGNIIGTTVRNAVQ